MAQVRGLFTHAAVLYVVIDDMLLSVDSNGVFTTCGVLNSGGGVVDFASNLTQLVANDGSYLYVYSPSTTDFSVATGYVGGDRIWFIDQRILFLERGTQKFGWTPLGDARTIDALAFASAEGSPDTLVAGVDVNRDAWLFGESSTEVWRSVGGEEVFARTETNINYGCAAAHSAQRSANSVTWLSRDEHGQAMVLRAEGGSPARISTRAIEERFDGLDLSASRAFCYSDGGQHFYCLNVPNVSTTLVYDETFKQWHERAELVNGNWRQWRPVCHAFAYGKHFFGGSDGSIYTLDAETNTYGSSVKARSRIAPVISKPSRKRVFFPSFEVVCEKGTEATLQLRWSDDNGATWSNWKYASAGEIGEMKRRIRFNRLGSGYDRVFELRCTDDAPFNPVLVNVEAM